MSKDFVKQTVEEILLDEFYDFQEEYNEDDVFNLVYGLLRKIKFQPVGVQKIDDCLVKFKNAMESSFISWSSTDCTGVSRSCYFIIEPEKEPDRDDIENLLEMINEAWYLCNN